MAAAWSESGQPSQAAELVDLPENCRLVQRFLDRHGCHARVRILPASTRTAAEAAAAIGCSPAQIAKSIVFRATESDRHVLVIACGDNRVSEQKVAALIGERIGRADADFVRARTGYVIGGVAPFAHRDEPIVLLDRTVTRFEQMWAAAGTPNAIVTLATADLVRLAGGPLADIAQ